MGHALGKVVYVLCNYITLYRIVLLTGIQKVEVGSLF